jgi:uncharacterized coiled-coil protein SlyX
MKNNILNSVIKFGSSFSKLSWIGRLAVLGGLIYVAFMFGNCNRQSEIDKFLVEYKEYQTQAKNAVTYGDSLKAEIRQLEDSVATKNSLIKEFNVSITFSEQKRKALNTKLHTLEERLEVAKSEKNDTLIIATQDTIIGNLKSQLTEADSVIGKQKQVIELKDSQIVLLTSALELSKTRGDSLTTILNNIPKAPQTKPKFMGITLPSRKATAIAAFTLGVVAGASF